MNLIFIRLAMPELFNNFYMILRLGHVAAKWNQNLPHHISD